MSLSLTVPELILSFSVAAPPAGSRQTVQPWDQIAQFPRGNHFSLSSSSFSSLMLVAATKVFLLFTVTSSTIPYSSGTNLYSSCEQEADFSFIKQFCFQNMHQVHLGDFCSINKLLSEISVKTEKQDSFSFFHFAA